MPEQIRDGTGKGFLAEVDSDNRLTTRAVTQSELAFAAESMAKSFSVYGKRNFVAANTNENIFYMTYTGTGQLHIQSVTFSSNSSSAKVEMYFLATSVSGGTAVVPLNLNRGSAIVSEATCLNGNADLTATTDGINEIFDVRLNVSTFTQPFDGGIILRKNDNLLILGEVAVIGDKIRTMVFFYED